MTDERFLDNMKVGLLGQKLLISATISFKERQCNLTYFRQNHAIYQNLIYLLASNPDTVHSRQTIFDYAWGEDILVGRRTIDVHIRRLRAKIGEHYIKTIKGVGYQFNE